MFFNDIENIIKGNQIYDDKINEFLFNKLRKLPSQVDIKNIFSKINLLDEDQIESILKYQKDKYLFSFINIDLIQQIININASPRLINKINDSHFLLFKNKNEYYITNNGYPKIYKIVMINKNEFKLEKFKENKNKNIKDLINSDENNRIKERIKSLEKENKKLNENISRFPFIL